MWMIWPGVPRPGYRKAIEAMDEYLLRIIAERRAVISSESPPPEDLLGILIESGMEDGLIRDQLLTMLIAGHDTVTALMAWTFYLLGTHPGVMKRAREEVAAIQTESFLELETISRLGYLGQVIRESLRLYPPIHLGSRLAAADLNFMGYRIPKDTRVVYSIYLTQRHPDFWPDPHRFDPERHSPHAQKTPYAWLAFGGGPRNCIGAAFGLMEASLVIAAILRKFSLELVERNVHPHMGATLEPHPGVRMKIRKLAND
jgi:cytochrome P450